MAWWGLRRSKEPKKPKEPKASETAVVPELTDTPDQQDRPVQPKAASRRPVDHIAAMDRELKKLDAHQWVTAERVRATEGWKQLDNAPEPDRVAVAVEAVARASRVGKSNDFHAHTLLVVICQELLRKKMALSPYDRVALLRALVAYARRYNVTLPYLTAEWEPTKSIIRALERGGEVEPLPDEMGLLRIVRQALIFGNGAEAKRCVPRVDALLGEGVSDDRLFSSPDRWARALEETIAALPEAEAAAGVAAIQLAKGAKTSKASKRFLGEAMALSEKHGTDVLSAAVSQLLRKSVLGVSAESGQVDTMTGDVLRGLCWVASVLPPTDDLAAGPGAWIIAGWAKVPGLGPCCRKAAGGAAWALARLGDPGAAQLGRARSQVRQPQAVAELDAAIDDAARELGIPRDEFEERVVPTYGLEVDARRSVELGDFTATMAYAAGKAAITITAPDGKVRKTVPTVVRREHATELTELKALAKDVSTMVSAQRLRLERLLLDDRAWAPDVWRERYLDHPLVSVLARRLIWQLDGRAFIAHDGTPRDLDGQEMGAGDQVRLWHPAVAPTAEVEAWRRRVEDLGVVQPFKQAHREVYLLTDAEIATDTYSNRFAGHIVRQHQFAALARVRGWRYALQGAWDQPDEIAELRLQGGITATFWVDRPWDADDDWNETGVFNHVLTDQVRFRTATADDVALRDVPVRVLSEVLRDVDLFVGVASIGNDPTWQDSGGARRETWGEYWSSYSFGELGAAAEVRRDLLARLLPKLALRDVATLDERFLVVQGSLRTYKIHLGSGNILMTPNDQYLCIVPGRSDDSADGVHLPFEGDRMLSIVLSKALLLARDEEITDRTITSQIRRT